MENDIFQQGLWGLQIAMTDSLRSRKYLYKRTIRNANAFDFVSKMLSFMLCAFLLASLGYSE